VSVDLESLVRNVIFVPMENDSLQLDAPVCSRICMTLPFTYIILIFGGGMV